MMIAAALFALPFTVSATPQPLSSDYYVQCDELRLGGGRVLENAVVHVVGGKIESVGSGVKVPDGAHSRRHSGIATPGLVAVGSALGVTSDERNDSSRSLLPEARIGYAVETSLSGFGAALAQGVTSAVVVPSSRGLAGGVTAVYKTHGGRVLNREAHLSVSLSGAALSRTRRPTSYSGARADLDAAFASATGVMAAALSGELPVYVHASSQAEVARALAFAKRHGLANGVFRGVQRAEHQVEQLRESGWGVVVGPFAPGTSQVALDSVAELGNAGVPLGFALPTVVKEHAYPIRLTAALAVQAGLDSEVALSAMTATGARLAGVADQVGQLEPGMDADFVLWSGDPLDLSSRVVAVYVDGELAYGGNQ